MVSAKENFAKKAPRLMDRLLDAFGEWDELDAAACAGNGGHESGGFASLQETNPTVAGSKGGYGWFQWTGPRRRKFEAWCKANGVNPSSDEASIQYVIVELKGEQKAAVRATAKAAGLDAKVKAFEASFERAGVKHYDSRIKWAKIALDAWKKRGDIPAVAAPVGPIPINDPATITAVQTTLTALKYNPGGVDGKIGPLTRGAILAFRNDHDLPPVDYIDTTFLEKLKTASPRVMVPERANADSAAIATMVPEANAHWWNKYIGLGTGVVTAAGGAVDQLAPATGALQPVKDFLGNVPVAVWIVAIVVVAGVIWYNARSGQQKVDEAYRNGDRR